MRFPCMARTKPGPRAKMPHLRERAAPLSEVRLPAAQQPFWCLLAFDPFAPFAFFAASPIGSPGTARPTPCPPIGLEDRASSRP